MHPVWPEDSQTASLASSPDAKDPHSSNRNMTTLVRPRKTALGLLVGGLLTAVSQAQVTPCAENNFCSSNPNATGQAAVMSSNGQCVVADNNFTLMASPVPNSPGLFFYGQGQAGGGAGIPFGLGLRCVGGPGNPVFRLPVSTASGNTLSRTLDFGALTTAGSIFPGSTWNFQAWFRDTDAMGMATFNLSDGLQVTFLDPLPDVEFSLPNRSVPEGIGTAFVKVELSQTSFVDVEVAFTVSGDALNPDDYTVSASPLVIPAGQLSADIVVTVVEDALYEGDENIEFQLGAPVNGVLGAQQTTVLKLQEDDPVPQINFQAETGDIPEGGGPVNVVVELSSVSDFPVSVPFVLSGTAVDPDDYSVTASPVSIPAGSTTVDIVVTPVDDALVELGETVVITLGTRTNAVLGSQSVFTGTIQDNDSATVEFDMAASNLGEGDDAVGIQLNLSAMSTQDVMVSYTVGGTASDPADYTITPSPVTIPAGSTTVDIALDPQEDLLVEGPETVIITLTGATNAGLGTTQVHTATLQDNDVPTVEFAAAAQNVDEGGAAAPIVVNLSDALGVDVMVSYTVGGTATDPDDYGITMSPITIPAGQMSANIVLTPQDDLLVEGPETVVVTLTGATNAGLGGTQVHTATLIDDDSPTVEFAAAAMNVDEDGAAAPIVVNLSDTLGVDVMVSYTVGGTATDPDDYGITMSPITIPAGQMSANIVLTPMDDLSIEGDETVVVTLTGATNADLGTVQVHTATIVDDDELIVDFDAELQDIDESAGPTDIVVSLSALSPVDVMVSYTVGGSATDPDDYSISASPLTIPAGQMSANIVVTPVDDTIDEPDETVIVTLVSATNATLGPDDLHTATLIDDDVLTVQFDLTSSDIDEDAGLTGLRVSLSEVSGSDVDVAFTVGGTATDPDDYSISASPVTISAGQLFTDIEVSPVDDMDTEGDETIVVTITSGGVATVGPNSQHSATLVDNDVPPGLVSDDFNKCALDPIWSLTDPQMDATLETRGAGSDDAQLLLGVPAGTHTLFGVTFSAPTVTQSIPDADFSMDVKFDSLVTALNDDQGIVVLEDQSNWIRFDVFRGGGGTLGIFAASTVAQVSTTQLNASLGAATAPVWLRITRAGDTWTLFSSLDGVLFTQQASFMVALNVTEAGVYVGNNGGPAFTAIVDYVFETSAPIVPEDGAVIGEIGRMLTINTTGMGSVTRDPDLPLYYCSDDVTLTAVPAAGWMFDRWEMDLTGSTNPDTVTMSADRNVTAVFVQAPLTAEFAQASSSIGEAAGPTPIVVNLSAAAPGDVTVNYTVGGTATDPDDYSIDMSPLVIGTGQMSGNIVLTPVDEMDIDPGEDVVITITSVTGAMTGTTLVHTATLVDNDGAVLVSDDFNKCTLDPIWSLTDPQTDATLETRGAGSDDAQLLLGVPAGTHTLFNSTFSAPTVTQMIPDADFSMDVKFDSLVTALNDDQGIVILEDQSNWIRFDVFRGGGGTLGIFAATTVAQTSTTQLNGSLGAATAPVWLRITRAGDTWTLFSSLDGVLFTQQASFMFALNVTEAGVYVGNNGGPAFTAIVDYVFETSAPIVPEDGAVIGEIGRTLTINTTGMGSVTRDPDLPLYYCSDDVTLTAVPAAGWMFDRWEMDLTGSTNPDTVTMSADRNVTAVFVQAPLTAEFAQASSSIGEAAGPTPIVVNLSAAAPGDVTVNYTVGGTATDPDDYSIDMSPLVIGTGQMSGNIVLTPVDEMDIDPGEDVVITITSVTGAMTGTTLVHTATLVDNDGVVLVSDDFNKCALDPIWSLTDPLMDATLETRGAGSDDAQLLLGVPAGTHTLFNSTFSVPTVTQMIPDADFSMDVKFESLVTALNDDQGIVILEDQSNWIRFDVFRGGGGTLGIFAASTAANVSTQQLSGSLGVATAPVWLRITRAGDTWTLFSSLDGVMFTQQASFMFALNVTEAGVYVGNNGGPAFTAIVDYVFETSAPIVPEDGAVIGEIGRTLTINTTGMGSVTRDPDLPLYYCSDDVTLTAVPDAGWTFDRWEMDLTGSTNPDTITMSADRNVTAVFVADVTAPLITNIQVFPQAESALVTWTTNEPATSIVDYGIGGLGQTVSDPTLVTSHSVSLPGLTPNQLYDFQVTSIDAVGLSTTAAVDTFNTLPLGFQPDDFNHPNLDQGHWTFEDPLGGGDVRITGAGTPDARLVLVAPGGGQEYLPWTVNDSVRVMQPCSNTDLEVTVKFEADLDQFNQIIGIAFEETPDTWMRFDFHYDGTKVNAFAAGITASVSQVTGLGLVHPSAISSATPLYMRVRRVGDSWTQDYSFDGSLWTQVNAFTHSVTVQRVGLFAGNAGLTPSRTETVVDFIASSGIPAGEDVGTPTDTTAPFLYRLDGAPLNDTAVEVSWAGDEMTTVDLEYGLTNAYELGTYGTYPADYGRTVVVSGLTPDTPYFFRVVADDDSSNQSLLDGLSLTPFPAGFTGFPEFEVWYGQTNGSGELVQRFGHLGLCQDWVNILGNVQDLNGSVASLTYSLNGGAAQSLSIGFNQYPWRLSTDGDFNVELATTSLLSGMNDLLLTATDDEGNMTSQLVKIDFTTGVVWPSTYSIDWTTVTDVQDVAQIVDGKWRIEDDAAHPGERVIRTEELGYDRIVDIGDVVWDDYEVTFQMTAHGLDPAGFTPSSNSYAIGFIMRWTGHFATDDQRPRVGFMPFGGVFAYRWFPTQERWDHYGTDFVPNVARFTDPVVLGTTYEVKGQVETEPDGTRMYRMRIWERGQTEPSGWLYEIAHSPGSGLASGSLLLFANHVDASFGNVSVVPLP